MQLRAAVGDAGWTDLSTWLQRRLLQCWQSHGGRALRVDRRYAVAFADLGSCCLRCVSHVRRSLLEHRAVHGFAAVLRLAIVCADAVVDATTNATNDATTDAATDTDTDTDRLLTLAEQVVGLAQADEVAILGKPPVAAVRRLPIPGDDLGADLVDAEHLVASSSGSGESVGSSAGNAPPALD